MEFEAFDLFEEMMARLDEQIRRADAKKGRQNYCKWIDACYGAGPKPAVQHAVGNRRHHTGYMASYTQAFAIVRHELDTAEGPTLASWF